MRGVSRSIAWEYTSAFDLRVAGGVMLGFSKYIDFKWLYLILAVLPFQDSSFINMCIDLYFEKYTGINISTAFLV